MCKFVLERMWILASCTSSNKKGDFKQLEWMELVIRCIVDTSFKLILYVDVKGEIFVLYASQKQYKCLK